MIDKTYPHIVTKLCDAVDKMNLLLSADIFINTARISMISLILDEIDSYIDILRSGEAAEQYSETDRDEFIYWIHNIEKVVRHNRRSITEMMDSQLIYKQLNILGY